MKPPACLRSASRPTGPVLLLLCAAALLFAQNTRAQEETVYMAVLSVFPGAQQSGSVAGFLASTDRGASWSRRGWRDYNRVFWCEQASDGTIWCACGNGVLRSTDGGFRWRTTTGWQVTEVLRVRSAESNPSLVFAAGAYGIFRSTDAGGTWLKTVRGLRRPFSSDVCIDRTDPARVVAATEVGVYRSEDAGDHWTPAGLEGIAIRVLLQDPHDPRCFWLGTEDHGVFFSSDRGGSWQQRSVGLRHRTVYTIDADPVTPGKLVLGTWGGGVYLSTDSGCRWDRSSSGLTDSTVHAVLFLPSDPDTVFAGTLDRGLFLSTDAGAHWRYLCQDNSQVWGLSARRPAGGR